MIFVLNPWEPSKPKPIKETLLEDEIEKNERIQDKEMKGRGENNVRPTDKKWEKRHERYNDVT